MKRIHEFSGRDAVKEALDNMAASRRRSWVIACAICVILASAFTLSAGEAQRIQSTFESQIDIGRFAYLASPGANSTMTSGECEELNAIEGVEAAGAIVAERSAVVVAGSHKIRILDVTEGFVRAAWPDVTPSGLQVIVPVTLGKALGVSAGSSLFVGASGESSSEDTMITFAATSFSRVPGIEDALVRVVAQSVEVRQCLVWASPSAYPEVGRTLQGWFGTDAAVNDFLTQIDLLPNPQQMLQDRLGQWAWLVGAMSSLALLLFVWFSDRDHVALYRILGMRDRHILVMAVTQLVVLAIIPLQVAVAVALVISHPTASVTMEVVAADWIRTFAILVIFPAASWFLVRSRSTVDYLKGL